MSPTGSGFTARATIVADMNRTTRLTAIGAAPDDATWQAIEERRPAQPEGAWFLVVATTGIICRPGCAARIPQRKNVRIVRSVAEGVAAGARPCLRCRPDRPASPTLAARNGQRAAPHGGEDGAATIGAAAGSPGSSVAADVLERLERSLANGEAPPSDRELAMIHGLSERRLRSAVREATGVTPRAWLAARRAERLREGLAARQPVLDALFDAGYEASSSAYEAANAVLGMAPGRYRDGGPGERIGWTIAPTDVGWALLAATERGLCAVKLGDDVSALESELRSEFPRAEIVRDDRGLARAGEIVADLAAGRPQPEAASIPLDLAGTAFRRRVWETLRKIPAGETWTYQFLAASVGAPKAARAVGTACATNPVCLVVPCHRVVGTDGRLHGYRWGLDRKRKILDAEARARSARDDHAGESDLTEAALSAAS